jgi:DNA-binding transcriptional LysR family regulator
MALIRTSSFSTAAQRFALSQPNYVSS